MTLPRRSPFIPRPIRRLLAKLRDIWQERGAEAYLVGGFLRDLILGRPTGDIDIALTGDALKLSRLAADALHGHWVPLHEEHAVARTVLPQRAAVRYVDVAALRGGSIETDLASRDFTIDAMALPLDATGKGSRDALIDPFGGRDDLDSGTIRAVGSTVFRDDGLRLLRAVRLAAELDFSIEPLTAALIERDASHLTDAARERQRDELVRTLLTPRSAAALRLADRLGLLDRLLPELGPARGVVQPKGHFWDVFNHLLETLAALDFMLSEEEPSQPAQAAFWRELWGQLSWLPGLREHFRREAVQGRPRTALLKLAGLLHDIDKPEAKFIDAGGRIRFFGHPQKGAEKAERLMSRLRFGAAERKLVGLMVRHHMRPGQLSAGKPPSRRALYRFFRDAGDAAIDVLFLFLADHMAARGPRLQLSTWRRQVAYVSYVLRQHYFETALTAPPRLVTGDDLMEALRIGPGPLVGRLLSQIEEAQAAGEVGSREEALDLAKRLLAGEKG
ncbi:MAG: HD domain-containing protein [Dehalococcoidia bacterium]|nr:HD domain-containing protein [Dehalococcoidia bacterium]